MKTNKILIVGLVISMILGLGITSSYAYGGNGQGYGGGQGGGQGFGKTLTTEQKAEIQSMNQEERQDYMQKLKSEKGFTGGQGQGKSDKHEGHNEDISTVIADIEPSDLSDFEAERLTYQYSEEMVARDAYNYLYELYGIQTFKNIALSEAQHMEAVKILLDRYGLDAPNGYGELQDEFDNLKAEGEKGLKEALEVGAKIEMLDIDDIVKTIKSTDNDDIKAIFTNIGGASYNHLRGFLNALSNNGYETDLDYSDYLSEEDLAVKGGGLKVKLALKLEAEGVELPNIASSNYIKEKCAKEEVEMQKGQNISSQVQNQNKFNYNSTLKNQYKTKYSTAISKMSKEKLNTLIEKIDILSDKVNNGNYLVATKQKYNSILLGLRELAVDSLNENQINIDTLFE
ncbi:MAG: DUF2202 domain-containing protein [Candidatus Gracilibacteria bacterium]|nr:DUF2202 domain-containing protein [Candidatus Gracilibacteria bacterium]